MPLHLLTGEKLKHYFGINTYHRGLEYFQKGYVSELEVSHKDNTTKIAAYVEGSTYTDYRVRITLSGSPKNAIIRGLCTCPVINNCKHIVATLLEALAHADLLETSMEPSPSESLYPALANLGETSSKPIVHLHLSQQRITGLFEEFQWELGELLKPVALLSFEYDGIMVPYGDNPNVMRNRQEENLAIETLTEFGLACLENEFRYSMHPQNDALKKLFLIKHDKKTNAIDFSVYAIPLLKDKGWIITMDTDYPYQVITDEIDDWYSAVEESSGHDWFNLELGISLNGKRINLLPILQKLVAQLSNHKQSNLDHFEAQSILVELPEDGFIALPAERVRTILKIFIELYDSTSLSTNNTLRLSRFHAARLLELEAAMGSSVLRWHGAERLHELANKLTHFTGLKEIVIPNEFKGELRPYQQDGVNWLQFLREYELGGILADDMGLGKTVQTLAHLVIEKQENRMTNPTLIIAPTSLMYNWLMEAERFSPHLKTLVLHGKDRKKQFETIAEYDLVLTTYPLLKRDKSILLKQQFHFLILDEAQFIKNSKSLSAQIVQQLNANHRLCLTGTPLENHLGELWSLFHFMMPGLLGDQKSFNRQFRAPIEKHNNKERRDNLIKRITPFLLRRTKNNVAKELPEKNHIIRYIELEGPQRDLYETIRTSMQDNVKNEIAKLGLARSHIIILDALLKLRQICCDPRLLKLNSALKTNAASAKLELLMTLIPELLEEGRRILIFSQFTEMLKLIEKELAQENISYVKLTGQTVDRMTPVQQFQQGEVSLFLISLKAGGTGLNLTAADTVIHYDPWWNPAVEDQATDRAHRIGQDKTVFVYKLVTKSTVEEKILTMQEKKRELMLGLFSENKDGKLSLTEEDLRGFFEPLGDS
jgi:SNF2 family DNA or RNA helicase